MSNYSLGLWEKVTIYCLNHEKPVPMQLFQNLEKMKSPYFNCSLYEEQGCPNRLNTDDYQGLVEYFLNIVANDDCDSYTDYTNFRYVYKGTRHKLQVKILKYSDEEIRIGILNTTVLGK